MSWQEELRKLDEELAAGRISADDYRVRRDQVLSSAVSQEDPDGQPQQPAQSAAGADQRQPREADSTQVVSPVEAPQNPDSTQVGSPGQQNVAPPSQSGQQQPWGTPGQQASPPRGFQRQHPQQSAAGYSQPPQQQPQPTWNAPEADVTPPWGGSDLPPIQAGDPGGWASQGPEGFEERSGTNKAKIATVVVAVVLLGGAAFGAYWLWGRGEASPAPNGNAAAQQPPAQAPPTQQPQDQLPLAKLRGVPEKHPEVADFTDVAALNYLNEEELGVYKTTSPGKTKFRVQHFGNGNLAVFLLVKTSGVDDKQKIEQKLADIQVSNGAKEKKDAPTGVAATTYAAEDGSLTQIRGHYFSGNVLVRIEVISKKSLESARTQFSSVIKKQLQELPAHA